MNSSPASRAGFPNRGVRSQGRVTPLLALVAFLLGAGLSAVWFQYARSHSSGQSTTTNLSAETIEQLRQLKVPVQIRFYSVLPGASQTLQDFSQRVDKLLSEFQNTNPEKIQIVKNISTSNASADAAAADGIRAFNLDKGDACFLGITVASGDWKESLAQLQPEWEPALPYDLIRSIQRVAAASPAAPVPQAVPKPSPAITESVHQLIPDINAVTTKQADQIFHDEFMKEYQQASAEMEKESDAAAQAVVKAQNGGTADELAAAKKHLLDLQLAQGEKIKQLAADLQTRLAVFQQLKNAATNSTK